MSASRFDLAHLLHPLTRQSFFDEYWERKPLHLRREDARYYDEVLTTADLERCIASPEARYPDIQLSKGGGYFPPEVYSEDVRFGSNVFSGVPNVQKLTAEYRAGATVVLPALHRRCRPLGELCADIESELNHVVHANAYLTPGNTAGFTPHYDTHEVLVLQLSGEKSWRIYPPPIELPHRKQPFSPVGYTLPSSPLLEVNLAPGDLLYLPRGYVHTTSTAEAASAHVTMGIAVYTWLDLAGELLQSAMTNPTFRKALPVGFAGRSEVQSALPAELSRVLDELRIAADPAALIEQFLARSKPNTVNRAQFRCDVSVIGPSTLLTAPAPEEFRIGACDNRAKKFLVEFEGRRFLLPAQARSALESMRTTRAFTADGLPGSLDLEVKLALVRMLEEQGFLKRLVSAASSHGQTGCGLQ